MYIATACDPIPERLHIGTARNRQVSQLWEWVSTGSASILGEIAIERVSLLLYDC